MSQSISSANGNFIKSFASGKKEQEEKEAKIIQNSKMALEEVEQIWNSINDGNFEEFQTPSVHHVTERIEEEEKIGQDGILVSPHIENLFDISPLVDNRMSLKKPKQNIFAKKIEIIESENPISSVNPYFDKSPL